MSTRVIRGIIGFTALGLVAATVVMGLFVTPPDAVQGNLARLLYVHPPVAWVAYLAYGVTSIASALYLWRPTRSRRWDQLAVASAEVGVVFTGLTLVTGSIWGRPAWGVWWTWDARLTTTAILFVLYLGYLALRRIPTSRETRARRSAIAALIAFIDVPIVHESVVWWRTLHQGATVASLGTNSKIHGIMAWTLLLGFVAFTFVYLWMTMLRFQVERLAEQVEDEEFKNWELERAAESEISSGAIATLLGDGIGDRDNTLIEHKVR